MRRLAQVGAPKAAQSLTLYNYYYYYYLHSKTEM